MEYFVNLLRPNKKSKFRIYSGIILLALGFFFAFYYSFRMEYYFWVLFGCYMFIGLFYLLNGLGVGVRAKAYVKITDKGIYSKLGKRELEERAGWDEIKSMSYKSNRFTIERKDGTSFEIYSSMLPSDEMKKLKEIIQKNANNYHIPFVIGK